MEISALKIEQWLNSWENVNFDPNEYRRMPNPKHLYLFTMDAIILKRLSKVYRREPDKSRKEDTFIQRKHDPKRSEQIREFVFGGFPWSDLSPKKRESEEYKDLKMPGWLPTAIIANILGPGSKRGKEKIDDNDLINVKEEDEIARLILPNGINEKDWEPDVAPIEIIDGQHRLWAFNKNEKLEGNFNFPVVAFYNLDISWQAYLFYTINIKPKKINTSLAYDLYPILRVQDWLERSPKGAHIYKETRAQELTEVLWSHTRSPWKNRINMLGEKKGGSVTQAAFIRALINSFIKTSKAKGNIGGLFGSLLDNDLPLNWGRPQQAGFLVLIWEKMYESVKGCNREWANKIRSYENNGNGTQKKLFNEEGEMDPAFTSKFSLLATDQGVRAFMHVVNDLFYVSAEDLNLNTINWSDEINSDTIKDEDVDYAIETFEYVELDENIKEITNELIKFNWYTSSFPELSREEQENQMLFKGSSGYKELRRQLLETVEQSNNEFLNSKAQEILKKLKYV